MPLERQDSFRNRKWEAFCLKSFRLCAREKEPVCVAVRGALVWTHPAGPVGSRAGIGLARPARLLSSTKAHLFCRAVFPESQNQGSFLFFSFPRIREGCCVPMPGKVNTRM